MRVIKKLVISGILFTGWQIYAQETLPIYQQYLLGGKFLINPAFNGATDDFVIHGTYQKQFSKMDDSPNVQTIGIHTNLFDRVAGGVSFFRDQNGPISANGFTVAASYFVPLSDDDGRPDQFSFGTSVNFYNTSFDSSLFNNYNTTDPLLDGKNSTFILYSNLGVQATYKRFFGSISVLDIPLTNNTAIINGIEPSPTKFLFNFGYDLQIDDGLSIEPSFLLNLNTNSSRMLDVNIIGKVYNDVNKFGAGVSFRMATDHTGRQQLELSPLIKAQINRLTVGASYSFGLSDLNPYGGNNFMVSLGYHFDNFVNGRGFRYR